MRTERVIKERGLASKERERERGERRREDEGCSVVL